jgi:aldose 1-epimerase|tara:strand:+ start:1626 stop:2531 length:906 start_codon:yes stop_codon:yes gene_type:complete
LYKITEIVAVELNYIELESPDGQSKAQICINQGGRLSDFVFKNIQILADSNSTPYKDTFASSILFPFANRIKDGEYTFNNLKYKLQCNEIDKNNALHGFVYNKPFEVIDSLVTQEFASLTLLYKDDGKTEGFPFKFNIELTYKLYKNGIILSIKAVNNDKSSFPFNIGWHPYFYSKNFDNSALNFKSATKYVYDAQQIISGTTELDVEMPFQLKDVKLDTGYLLTTNEIKFSTPEYNLNIISNSKDFFLQLYTPDDQNIIAIEPMTGAADNFNNEIGLQTLQSNETYDVKWCVSIETLKLK